MMSNMSIVPCAIMAELAMEDIHSMSGLVILSLISKAIRSARGASRWMIEPSGAAFMKRLPNPHRADTFLKRYADRF